MALWLLCAALFVGPSGKFFFPVEIGSLKLFMLASIAAFFAILYKGVDRRRFYLISGVMFFYAFFIFLSLAANPTGSSSESLRTNSLLRSIIHLGVFSGFVLMGISLSDMRPRQKFRVVNFAIKGYVVVTCLGFVLYFLTVAGVVPRSFYVRFVILDQQAYGFIRFSPGTYGNEWGILASFFSGLLIVVAIKSVESRHLNIANLKLTTLFILLSILGLTMATTRTAFGTFILSIPIIFYYAKSPKLIGLVIFASVPIIAVIWYFVGDILLNVFNAGVRNLGADSKSVAGRLDGVAEAYALMVDNLAFGVGFQNEQITGIHNLYMQYFSGIGFIQAALIFTFGPLFVYFLRPEVRDFDMLSNERPYLDILRFACVSALLHVAIFGLTNHNQNHFLTFLMIFLFIVTPRKHAILRLEA